MSMFCRTNPRRSRPGDKFSENLYIDYILLTAHNNEGPQKLLDLETEWAMEFGVTWMPTNSVTPTRKNDEVDSAYLDRR